MPKPTCRWPECERPASSRGLCTRDYGRARRVGDMQEPWLAWRDARRNERPSACQWPGCSRLVAAHGFCTRDLRRAEAVGTYGEPWLTWRDARTATPGPRATCRWPDCGREAMSRGLCRRDYQRAATVGDMDEPWIIWGLPSKCSVCSKAASGRVRNMRFCSPRCSQVAWSRANPEKSRAKSQRRRALKLSTMTESFTESDVRMAHGDDCYLCGDRIDFRLRWPHPKSPSLDHVVPLSAGGTHTLDNVAMTCLRCNHSKNARPTESAPIPTLFAPH